ncbi:MAG: hypothetical protein RLZ98_263 [Pseudomonadota bacterium]|jgi:hypothetical protein
MKLGIMQPYFAPYLGYFDLIRRCDQWVVFDTAQYIRHGWVNRNRVLHPTTDWQYLIVPLQKHSRETPIKDIKVIASGEWRSRIRGQLQHYRGKAPHYQAVVDLVSSVLAVDTASLTQLNILLLQRCCERLGLRFNFQVFSEMNLPLPEIMGPGHWALEISSALKASEYLNPPGGKNLFKPDDFRARGIKLTIQEPHPFIYPTPGYGFQPDLSVIDVMMWNSPAEITAHLDQAGSQP